MFLDPTNAPHWPPILFMCDLYSQALITMGDDEFFGSTTARNPLNLDELVSFGKQLLNIAFTLYWRDDQTLMQETYVSSEVRCTWEDVRDKATKCLLDIHAREYVSFFVVKTDVKCSFLAPENRLYLQNSGLLLPNSTCNRS